MQTKLIEILSAATGWLQANKIADLGGWRSAANVGVALQQMEKATAIVERRKSPTAKMGNGMPATEWKLTEKVFVDPDPAVRKSRSIEAIEKRAAEASADRHNKAAKLDEELESLRANLKLAEQQRNAHFASAETAMSRVDELVIENAKLRAELDELFLKLGHAQESIHQMELEAEQSKTVKDAAIGYIVRVVGKKPRICAKPESAHAAAMSSARAHGKAEVLALVPVGKAVRGAEWKEAA